MLVFKTLQGTLKTFVLSWMGQIFSKLNTWIGEMSSLQSLANLSKIPWFLRFLIWWKYFLKNCASHTICTLTAFRYILPENGDKIFRSFIHAKSIIDTYSIFYLFISSYVDLTKMCSPITRKKCTKRIKLIWNLKIYDFHNPFDRTACITFLFGRWSQWRRWRWRPTLPIK